ncbi:amidohydrolase [Ruegeria marina]|uniref:Hippurate hydrolase n=1 Tax=Ruegeria marina TaxID=639004 RepID=A0A1G6LFU1_9RHOB|nr:amidohydrolase [Ruegeria marina]SDC42043.1 hippurate hydrolase [Ruegeria marina]
MIDFDPVAFRRDLHAHPETGFEVTRTAGRIADVLERAGLEVARDVGGAGVVATLHRGGQAIGLRADMDALPIVEANTFSHRSRDDGRFHGCGHDGHSTMLLAAALKLASDTRLDRTVHFLFQPDEENGNGAAAMIADGLFERFPMSEIYGLHNMPGLELGRFGIQEGPFCAFEDNFEIHLTGRGGHSSMPESGVDAIVAGAGLVMQLQTIVSRAVPAGEHAVVSVTGFETDGARNVLAGRVQITGDCRGFSELVSTRMETRMREIVQGVAAAQGAEASLSYSTSFRPLVNDPQCTRRAADAAALGAQVNRAYGRVGFSEDFAEFLLHRPGAFILMGNGTEGAQAMPLHNPGYDFNDAAMPHGVAFWCNLALGGAGAA